jgi:hypothetical protein
MQDGQELNNTSNTETDTQKPGINKQDILKNLKGDMESADNQRLQTVTKVEAWKAEYNGNEYGNEEKGKSRIVSRDIKRQDEWQHASLKDPFLSSPDIIRCIPITAEDRPAAEQNELILNYQFTRKFNRYKFMTDSIKLLTTEGTLVVKTSWEYEDKIEEVEYPIYAVDPITQEPVQVDTKTVKQIKVLVNRPHAETCRIEDIYIDPTCMGDIDNCQFVIHRFESDISTLRASKKYKKSALDNVARDLRKDTGDFTEQDDTHFEFKDDPRKKILVHEYWGNYDIHKTGVAKPIVCTWVNDVIIRLQDNPYPDQKIPFLVVANNSIPFHLNGEANAEMIGDNQKLTTAIKRGIIDNMANSNNGQKGIKKGALDVVNRKRFLRNKHFEFNGNPADFFEGSYNSIPNSVFDMLALINNETESITGVKGFAGGINGGGLGNTATSARGALDAVSVRRLDIVRNIAENLVKPTMRKWLSYNAEFLRDEEVVRITNEEFIPIRKDDLAGELDIEIEVSTAEDDSSKGQQLTFLLQTLGQSLEPKMTNMLMSQIAKLHKMPDLAKSIKEYQPEPDPMAIKLQQLQIDKLQVEIDERRSRANENEVDMRLKTANAVLAEAKARGIDTDTDVKDLDFVKQATGEALEEDFAKEEHSANVKNSLQSN